MDKPSSVRKFRGRGALSNTVSRFEAISREAVDDGWEQWQQPSEVTPTEVYTDSNQSLITRNQSPDVPFEQSANVYRGCEHGCIYCFARPTHAYLGWSPGLDFETRLVIKPDSGRLLEQELCRPSYVCRPLALGTNTDPYQPIEKRYRLTREVLEILDRCNHPVFITTKGTLIERDLDLLARMAVRRLVSVRVSVTTLDRDLARSMEPRAAAPGRRFEIIRKLAEAGVPTGVLIAPVIPGLTEHELERLMRCSADCGASAASYVLLRLTGEVGDLFEQWLETHYPLKAQKVMSVMRQMRGGRRYDSSFGQRQTGQGEMARILKHRFELGLRKLGIAHSLPDLDCTAFSAELLGGQQSLFQQQDL